MDYFTAIRIPQALENPRLMQGVKRGLFRAEDLLAMERKALDALRAFDRGSEKLLPALNAIMQYHQFLVLGEGDQSDQEKILKKIRERTQRTLEERPWKRCDCDICQSVGVEIIIFRASNRNKRRGFHNLGVYHKHLQKTVEIYR